MLSRISARTSRGQSLLSSARRVSRSYACTVEGGGRLVNGGVSSFTPPPHPRRARVRRRPRQDGRPSRPRPDAGQSSQRHQRPAGRSRPCRWLSTWLGRRTPSGRTRTTPRWRPACSCGCLRCTRARGQRQPGRCPRPQPHGRGQLRCGRAVPSQPPYAPVGAHGMSHDSGHGATTQHVVVADVGV
uniref:Uncharacterized protein n=1 Tax=uncultured marine virus TaxID=186617 RepID=A0A0F7L6D2_9VIRU|nr:hypothetical protein [uncultured marine virus]